jgi:dihydrolipoamide dehydrogenase
VDAFDLIVIGGGTGGYTAAIKASQSGLKTALIERDKVGGVCLHRGCIPTKALLESAEVLALIDRSSAFGIETTGVNLDYSQLLKRQAHIVGTLHKNLRSAIQKQKVEIIEGEGRLLSPQRVAANGRTLNAKHVVVATGSEPQDLPGLPPDGDHILNSDHALALTEPPKSVAIVGAGAVGLEFASFYLDLGSEVTLIEMLPNLAAQEDKDLGVALAKLLTNRGAKVMTSTRVLPDKTRSYDDMVELTVERNDKEESVRAHKVLVAIGRRGNVDEVGLDNTRVQSEGSFIKVDGTMRTDEPNIYAVGDVVGGLLLAHVAAAEGVVAAQAIAGKDPDPLDYLRIPRVTYCRPQIAAVGLSEEAAKEEGHKVKMHRFSFRYNAMALIKDEPEGFAKVVSDAESGDLLGVHIFGHNAVDLISEAALVKWLDASTWEMTTSVRPHPSLSEVVGEAAQLSAGISIYW